MSVELIKRLKQSRESRVKCGDITFIITRPTEMDLVEQSKLDLSNRGTLTKYVVGWEGMREIDIISSGDDSPVPFDAELFALWIEDHSEHWADIGGAIKDAYLKHKKKKEEAAKN